MPYSKFVNYKTGDVIEGPQYFKSLADELWDYLNHPEAKLEGGIGTLQRRHIEADGVIYIGKEADKVEQNINGLERVSYNAYNGPRYLKRISSLTWEMMKPPEARLSPSDYAIVGRTWHRQ